MGRSGQVTDGTAELFDPQSFQQLVDHRLDLLQRKRTGPRDGFAGAIVAQNVSGRAGNADSGSLLVVLVNATGFPFAPQALVELRDGAASRP